jgi:hypothetical protein
MREAQRTVISDMYAMINVHRYTGIKPHSNPNQNSKSIPIIRAGFKMKKLIISTLSVVSVSHSRLRKSAVIKREPAITISQAINGTYNFASVILKLDVKKSNETGRQV